MNIKKNIHLLCCILGYSSCTLSQDVSPIFPCSTKLVTPYGVVVHFTSIYRDYPFLDRELHLLDQLGIDNARIDYWLDYRQKNMFNDTLISIMDSTTTKMKGTSIDILPIVFVGNKGSHPWDCRQNYRLFLNHLLDKYHNDFKYFEVMNEVNYISRKENITRDSLACLYTDILSETFKSVKKCSPEIKVISSGLAGTSDRFLESLSKYGAFTYFDILNIHSYNKPEDLPFMFKYIRTVMNVNNWEKPVWLSECGMSTFVDSLKFHDTNIITKIVEKNEHEQARRLPRIFLISFAYGIDKVFWYEFRSRENNIYDKEENFGIFHADLTPKPAYYAYKTLIEMCPNKSTRPTLSIKGNAYISSWKRSDGKYVSALWSKSNELPIDIKIKGTPKYYNIFGEQINKPNSINESVIYIVGAKSVRIM
ncbi:MAG: glycosyl hydrolase [Prevotella sp.]|nr:glycosyl hydrolase [Prevotella sp.]